MRRPVLALVLGAALASPCLAEVAMPAIFASHMVVQRGAPIPVWGSATPGAAIHVTFDDVSLAATAGPDGRWTVRFPAQESKGPHVLTVEGDGSRCAFDDVLVGQVWVCSGQSNMAFALDGATGGPQAVAASADSELRLFQTAQSVADAPRETQEGTWAASAPATAPKFSAVAWFFGAELRRELGEPVGLVEAAVGGTGIEAWMSREALVDPAFKPTVARADKIFAAYPAAKEKYDAELPARMKEWEEKSRQAAEAGKPVPARPQPPIGPGSTETLAGLYNGMIAPLAPFAIRGVIWYQGEHNVGREDQYVRLLPALVADWRKAWGEGDFPFLVVQLPNHRPPKIDPALTLWARQREAQAAILSVPNTGLAVTIDVGDAARLHPPDKAPVGHRLALLAEALAYGRGVESSGPVFQGAKREGTSLRLAFSHAAGLALKPGVPVGFAVAGPDGRFAVAAARIDGESVVLDIGALPDPLWVRYAWDDDPPASLINGAGLPAAPFRTDALPAPKGGAPAAGGE